MSKKRGKKDSDDLVDPKEEVRTRNDVSSRLAERKNYEMTTIKCSWSNFCLDHHLNRAILTYFIPTVNTIVFLAYRLLNYHFLRHIENGTLEVLPENISQTYIQKLFRIVSQQYYSNSIIPLDNDLEASFHDWNFPRNGLPGRDYCGYLLNTAAKEIEKNIRNHLALNFYVRLR